MEIHVNSMSFTSSRALFLVSRCRHVELVSVAEQAEWLRYWLEYWVCSAGISSREFYHRKDFDFASSGCVWQLLPGSMSPLLVSHVGIT